MDTLGIFYRIFKALLRKPKGKDLDLSRTEYVLTQLWSRSVTELADLALERKDWHEFNHCYAGILVSNSNHDNLLPECVVPKDRPIDRGEILLVPIPEKLDK